MSGAPDENVDTISEISPEMIEAGARVLWNDPFLYYSASLGHCEDLAEKVIRCALGKHLAKNAAIHRQGC
jgi:hypothetical protein